jgi:hypothetical protein
MSEVPLYVHRPISASLVLSHRAWWGGGGVVFHYTLHAHPALCSLHPTAIGATEALLNRRDALGSFPGLSSFEKLLV